VKQKLFKNMGRAARWEDSTVIRLRAVGADLARKGGRAGAEVKMGGKGDIENMPDHSRYRAP